ncbi:MAG: tRNA lysidine(34) synthetase TilS [Fretibacterium sp.]|nr:tRNA lysidine(34) synthetase TilS [Fretibacterium sp.]
MSRLSPEERAQERSRSIPYPLSLHRAAQHFWRTGTRQNWLGPEGHPVSEKPLLAAVSGGGDSVAMLWLFRRLYEGPLIVAHVNHGIRGQASDGDAAFVRALAGKWGLPFVERRTGVPSEREKGESLEMAARRVRQRELTSLADASGAWGIATAHTRDDLAETVLFNILRGTGIRGAVGIPERRGLFLRPVLDLSREFLRDLLRIRALDWREDETNEDKSTTRNFIRLELLPLIEKHINSGAAEHLSLFSGELSQWREEEERRGTELLLAAQQEGREEGDSGVFRLNRKKVAGLPPFQRALVIRAAGRRLDLPVLSRRRLEQLSGLIKRGGPFTFQWASGVDVITRPGVICWDINL